MTPVFMEAATRASFSGSTSMPGFCSTPARLPRSDDRRRDDITNRTRAREDGNSVIHAPRSKMEAVVVRPPWTLVTLALIAPLLALAGCSSEDERIAELERLEPAALVYLALDSPLTPSFEEPTGVEPQILAVLARAPERYVPALATFLDPAYDPNAASSPSEWAPGRAAELAAHHLGEPGRALLRQVYERVRTEVSVLEARERSAGDPRAQSIVRYEHLGQVANYQSRELSILRVFLEVTDPSLADSVIAKLRCFNPTVLEVEVSYLQAVNRLDEQVRARVREVIATSPLCYPSPSLKKKVEL